jgi:pimeloyl-ACP methyl ester carboxylesterase/DNA-binding winged helix-turn-helix (wHTH) protein
MDARMNEKEPQTQSSTGTLSIAGWDIHTSRNLITKDEQSVRLELRTMAVLICLAETPGEVVTRQQLEETVWPRMVIGYDALTNTVAKLRKAFGDDPKNPSIIETIPKVGYRLIAGVSPFSPDRDPVQENISRRPPFESEFLDDQSPGAASPTPSYRAVPSAEIGFENQSAVRYCLSADGVSIAHAQVGSGKPLVLVGSWMTHLEKDWENPAWGHHLAHLAKDFTVIRYDMRGNGMSDWDDVEISFEKMVDDLGSVIDYYEHRKVAILGASQGAAVAIAYIRQHPGRVSRLILYGGYARGRRRRANPEAVAESEALVTLIRQGWGRENPAFRQTITSLFMPEATKQEADWFNEFQRACGSNENMALIREVMDGIDVTELLDEVNIPTLVVHSVEDAVAPLSEGKIFATRIPNAEFVTLNSKNHMVFENEPAFPMFLHSVRDFLGHP